MKLPIQAMPVKRDIIARSLLADDTRTSGVTLSVCPTPDITPPGTCFDANGPIPGRLNCSACCALRGAISWQNGMQAFPC
jgi:hypothetical protein